MTQAEIQAQEWMLSHQEEIQDLNKIIIMKQRYDLAIFYYSTQPTSSSWTYCGVSDVSTVCSVNDETYYRWLSYTNHCSWYGITCDEDGLIQTVILDSNNLAGYLPHQIFNIKSLIRLSLRYNSITQSLPYKDNTLDHPIRTLLLNNNLLTGTIPNSFFVGMDHLQTISLGSNLLHGTIEDLALPKQSLIYFNVKGNGFSGSIPVGILFLDEGSKLEYIDIGSNQFTGTISSSWGAMKQLRVLTLYNNFFTGTLPKDILSLHTLSLSELSVGMNELTGVIPTLNPSTSTSSKLGYLNLGTNQLGGSIQSDFGNVFSSLESLILWQNQLTGSIPSSIGNIQSLEMFQLPYNNIIGVMPEEICDLRDDNLDILSSDCKSLIDDMPVKVTCNCCTTCYSGY